MTTPEDRLTRSLPVFRELIDSLASRSPSEANDLLRLDLLVRRYPAAARLSLHLLRRASAGLPVPPGWSPTDDVGDLPLWRWAGGDLCVASGDIDQLQFVDVALRRFDRMTAGELHAYLRG